ncbi:G-type lectin S-receptor-like serine threonine-kinase At2g19130 [Olea europaea subsp. europaea]|uniref:G-type lectin S-receptor-like serine threonine-kinase At2g19130 n=1 Tax=Olea europaea subsp. europaea TaxID=158383 RepID=A0A8S0SE74_OLEEU|nr:G-type lectin S-receptor-like serine threonine-kinase At2g19130 [Olea europaea subsp. europaea]
MLIELSLSLPLPFLWTTVAMITKKPSCFCLLVLFFVCFSININLSQGTDSITANQSLSGSRTIVSSGGTFELGFFKPGNSAKYYIGIWYKTVSPRTIVWVANRETPISDMNSVELKISEGNLVLTQSQVLIWSTSVNSKTSNSVVATLGYDGNLVLRDGSKHKSTEGFWQSFDHPTDTFFPGGKLSYDKRTKTKKILISWKNFEDPAPGLFSLELAMDPNGSHDCFLIRNRTVRYWTSGDWNSYHMMRQSYIINYTYFDNVNETYLTYSLYKPSTMSKLVMEVSGLLTAASWLENTKEWNQHWSLPKKQCEVYGYCGPFSICNQYSSPFYFCLPGFVESSEKDWNMKDYSGGCMRKNNLSCGNNPFLISLFF